MDRTSIDLLRRSMRGPILEPDMPGYDSARFIWNATITKRPVLIARCTGLVDVITALRFARDEGLEISLKGGGHNVAGFSLTEGGLMLDLSLLNNVRVDPDQRRVWVGGGATWAMVDRDSQHFGLATPSGVVSHTGVAGLTLGGGMGWIGRAHGLTCDNLIGCDLVTAAGKHLHVEPASHPELNWALRGGGGNFGIVTSFEFRLHRIGPQLLSGKIGYSAEDAPAVLRAYRDINAAAPDSLTCIATVMQSPALPFVPAQKQGKPMLLLWYVYEGEDFEAGRRLAAPLHKLASPIFEMSGPAQYTGLQSETDSIQCAGQRQYCKAGLMPELSDAAIEVFLQQALEASTGAGSVAVLWPLGGAIARVAEGATAYANRRAAFQCQFNQTWAEESEDEARRDKCRAMYQAIAPFASCGVYVNTLNPDESEARLIEAYGAEKLVRLRAIKRRYDPDNVFRLNANIKP